MRNRRALPAIVAAAVMLVASRSAYATNATTTTLALTSGGSTVTLIAAKAQLMLTVTVKSGSTPGSPSTVNICDANYTYCNDIHKLGTAQLTSAGIATVTCGPAPETTTDSDACADHKIGQAVSIHIRWNDRSRLARGRVAIDDRRR